MMRVVAIGLAFFAVVAIGVLGLLALARGPGSETATGEVVSISDVLSGQVVCVRDDESERIRCGEVTEADLPEQLDGVEVGGCAYIKVARDAAIELERRSCS